MTAYLFLSLLITRSCSDDTMVAIPVSAQSIKADSLSNKAVSREPVDDPPPVFLPLVRRDPCIGPWTDDFSDPASGWPKGELGNWDASYTSGEYRLYRQDMDEDDILLITRGDRVPARTDLAVDVQIAGNKDGLVGIVWEAHDDWEYMYFFAIAPKTQEWFWWEFCDGEWWALIADGTSTAIKSNKSNRLRLVCTGSDMPNYYQYELRINGTKVFEFKYHIQMDHLSGTYTGIVAVAWQSEFDARFDNYYVWPQCAGNLDPYPNGASVNYRDWNVVPSPLLFGTDPRSSPTHGPNRYINSVMPR